LQHGRLFYSRIPVSHWARPLTSRVFVPFRGECLLPRVFLSSAVLRNCSPGNLIVFILFVFFVAIPFCLVLSSRLAAVRA
jgi:hypothetical protein